jgi:hypothetical protein
MNKHAPLPQLFFNLVNNQISVSTEFALHVNNPQYDFLMEYLQL